MSKTALYNLLGKYLNNTCTAEERKLIDNLLELWDDKNIFESYREDDLNAIHSKIWQKIQAETFAPQDTIPGLSPKRSNKTTIVKWAIAASIVGVAVFAGIRFGQTNRSTSSHDFTSIIPQSGMIQQTNTTDKAIKMVLEDSSIIVIEPGTIINYPAHFDAEKREVYLEGKAFFDISKNARRPFFIYHNNLVTHVIGTSFIINTQNVNKDAEVSVLTGRVEVSENSNLVDRKKNQNENGVVLTTNQKVIYSSASRTFIASIVDSPIPVKNKATQNFDFENTEMAKVFDAISKEYGIEIVVGNENINNCTFTGNITRQNLYSKLDAICKSVNSTYELKGTMILIKGAGCE